MRTKDQNQAQCKLNCKLAAKELVVEEKLKLQKKKTERILKVRLKQNFFNSQPKI